MVSDKNIFFANSFILLLICSLRYRVEKYRPSTLQDLISHEDIIRTSK